MYSYDASATAFVRICCKCFPSYAMNKQINEGVCINLLLLLLTVLKDTI